MAVAVDVGGEVGVGVLVFPGVGEARFGVFVDVAVRLVGDR